MKGLLIGSDGRSRPLNPITSSNTLFEAAEGRDGGGREREREIKRCEREAERSSPTSTPG